MCTNGASSQRVRQVAPTTTTTVTTSETRTNLERKINLLQDQLTALNNGSPSNPTALGLALNNWNHRTTEMPPPPVTQSLAPEQAEQVLRLFMHPLAAVSAGENEPTPTTESSTLPLGSSNLGEEEELTKDQRQTLMVIALIVVSGIVTISIVFEKVQEYAEEHIIDVLKPILKSIFGELTILGFIGLIMFSVTKFGKPGLDALACQEADGWWGDNEEICPHNATSGKWEVGIPVPENPLIELTETAHMILFFVMMLFLFESFVLIERAMSHIREWKQYEDLCITHTITRALHEQNLAKQKFDKEGCCTRHCGYWFGVTGLLSHCGCLCLRSCTHGDAYLIRADYLKKTDFLRYCALRTALIKSYNKHSDEVGNHDHRLAGDFDFAEYSVKVLADKLSEIVELSTGNWLVIWLIFGLFLVADYIDLITESDTMFLAGNNNSGLKFP